jgi:uncharacterized protein (TIGR03790 family)
VGRFLLLFVSLFFVVTLGAQTADQVLVVINRQSPESRAIGEYYLRKRHVPPANLCAIDTKPEETIGRDVYNSQIEAPVGVFLKKHDLREKILYIVLTKGVPLRIVGNSDDRLRDPGASVDSELTLLYQRLGGATLPLAGAIPNPFFGQRDTPFRHPLFPIYLVTRLDGYNMHDVQALVDRALVARNVGKFVIDARADNSTEGNQWLRTAALLLPKDRVILEDSAKVVENIRDVIGYASWGSNDPDRKHRFVHFQWLPGAIATEFVSTNARTFKPPPDAWDLGTWASSGSWVAGAPQTLTGDYIHEGATGASGQVWEPFLHLVPRPQFVLPAYCSGRTLAESFYLGIPGLSWMNVVIGDPLARLKP